MKQLINKLKHVSLLIGILFLSFSALKPALAADYVINMNADLIYDSSETAVVNFGTYLYTGPTFDLTDAQDYIIDATSCFRNINIGGLAACPINTEITNGFYVVFGVRNNTGEHWAAYGDKAMSIKKGDIFIASLITKGTGSPVTGNLYTSLPLAGIKRVSQGAKVYTYITAKVDVDVKKSTCSISTSHNMAFDWPSLTQSEITNGTAPTKKAGIIMGCNANEIIPVSVTINSTNGSYDAAKGLVKTSKENVGLQLTWADDGMPAELNKKNDFFSSKDFSINAKPVQLGSGKISGGDFDTKVTVSIEYH
ncbi:fimbrial protein [Enterobacter bugandensis]